jgi:hypothetical protein
MRRGVRQAKPDSFGLKLYHFTLFDYVPSILKTGLDEGEIMLNLRERVNGISLTEDPTSTPRFQSWVSIVPQKLECRLTVELEPCEKLVRWKYVPDLIRLDRGLWRRLNGDPYKWWVYFGVVKPHCITEIFDTRKKQLLDADEMERIRSSQLVRGSYMEKFKWVSFEDALINPKP